MRNRSLIGRLADLHFAPTETARQHLLREGIAPETIHVTGNTVIDALQHMVQGPLRDEKMLQQCAQQFSMLSPQKKLLLVTGHRRENFGEGFARMCEALRQLAQRDDLEILYPVHLNPHVREPVMRLLGGIPSIHLVDPLDYLPFVYAMQRAHLILTDSGGIQEEAPALGKPVLVMREVTERPEAIAAGTALLVGTETAAIVAGVERLLHDTAQYAQMATAQNPYGDGHAATRIAAHVQAFLGGVK